MIYVFEDNKAHILAEFFERSYPPDVSSKFIYSDGNSRVLSHILPTLPKDEAIYVFLDMPPGNPQIRRIYAELRKAVKYYPKLLVLPVVCREYYLLASLLEKDLVTEKEQIQSCINREYPSTGTYEKWCKELLRTSVIGCAKLNVSAARCRLERPYYFRCCDCVGCQRSKQDTLLQKSQDFVRRFPCFPAGVYWTPKFTLTYSSMVDLHRKLVERYNSWNEDWKVEKIPLSFGDIRIFPNA